MEIDHNEIVERVFSALLRVNGFSGDTSRVDAVIKSHCDTEWLQWLELFDEAAEERHPRGTNGDLIANDGRIDDPGGLGGPGPTSGGGQSAPVFPSIYIGIAAALGAGIVAYFVRRRLAS